MGDAGDSPGEAPSSDRDATLARLFRDGRTNAMIAWVLVGMLALVFVESILGVDYRWILFVGVVGAVSTVPPLRYRDWQVMLPWELLVLALLPILVRALVGGNVGTFAMYLSLAALALLVIVELHMFTSLKATPWFAVSLVVLTTMAAVALWTVFRWHADRYIGTAYLVDNEALMMEWLSVALAGLVAGVLFESYFRRRDRVLWQAIRRTVER